MPIPKTILEMKPKALAPCKIQQKSGHYYVYEVVNKWDKTRQRPAKITGRCLGKITENDGFIPNRYGLSRMPANEKATNSIIVKNYGAYETMMQLAPNINDQLRVSFPQIFREIRTLALLRLIDGVGPKLTRPVFLDSYLSDLAPDLSLGETTVRCFVKELGMQEDSMNQFMRSFMLPGSKLAFDGTHFFASYRDGLSEAGYNPAHQKRRQIRILYIFDLTTHMPQFYQVLQGSAVDKTAFVDAISASGCQHCIIIADKGFYSKSNVSALMNEDLDIEFVLPLQSNTTLVEDSFYNDPASSKFDGLFEYHGRPIYFKKKSIGQKGNYVYVYFDLSRKSNQEARFLHRAKSGWEGDAYTDLKALNVRWGYFAFLSNKDTTAREIYCLYKERWHIEELYDYLKNVLAVEPVYAHDDWATAGWAFLNHISVMYFYALINALRGTEYVGRYTPSDVILLTKNIYAVKDHGNSQYTLSHVQTKTLEILNAMGVDLNKELRS